jgi:hypothetical protein
MDLSRQNIKKIHGYIFSPKIRCVLRSYEAACLRDGNMNGPLAKT